MFSGTALLGIAYTAIFCTVVAVVTLDRANLSLTVYQRLWLILRAPYNDAHPEVYRAAYAVIFPLASVLLYVMAYLADIRFIGTFYTSWYLLVSRLSIAFGEIFAWIGMSYCIVYIFDAMRTRAILRLLIFSFLLIVALSLLILNMFAFVSQWPPLLAWGAFSV